MNPYMLMPKGMQDVSGLQPVFQNFGQQQANQQAALAQQNQLVNQAGQSQGGGGASQLAMAAMLRKGAKPTQDEINAKDNQMGGLGTFNPFTQYDISQQYGTDMYSPQSRMLAGQELGMK